MKRTLYQCDRCSKTIEQPDIPQDWVQIEATQRISLAAFSKMWCASCWKDISARLSQATKP